MCLAAPIETSASSNSNIQVSADKPMSICDVSQCHSGPHSFVELIIPQAQEVLWDASSHNCTLTDESFVITFWYHLLYIHILLWDLIYSFFNYLLPVFILHLIIKSKWTVGFHLYGYLFVLHVQVSECQWEIHWNSGNGKVGTARDAEMCKVMSEYNCIKCFWLLGNRIRF